mmetsp:Transcript_30625/g.79724  ORF Transcript_30625/g.79724 Transcript_30625/m.79724 type:complete len:262 (-) Transcript_30625:2293-3078(-)
MLCMPPEEVSCRPPLREQPARELRPAAASHSGGRAQRTPTAAARGTGWTARATQQCRAPPLAAGAVRVPGHKQTVRRKTAAMAALVLVVQQPGMAHFCPHRRCCCCCWHCRAHPAPAAQPEPGGRTDGAGGSCCAQTPTPAPTTSCGARSSRGHRCAPDRCCWPFCRRCCRRCCCSSWCCACCCCFCCLRCACRCCLSCWCACCWCSWRAPEANCASSSRCSWSRCRCCCTWATKSFKAACASRTTTACCRSCRPCSILVF